MKPEAIDEIEQGARVTDADVARAAQQHEVLQNCLRRFFERYDFLACVVNQVPPFDVGVDWPRAIDGVSMETYTDWMKSAYWISVTQCPAISIPAGFTADTLPVGIQLVGRRLHDRALLELAHSFERALTALLPRVIPVRSG
jgi:amidase